MMRRWGLTVGIGLLGGCYSGWHDAGGENALDSGDSNDSAASSGETGDDSGDGTGGDGEPGDDDGDPSAGFGRAELRRLTAGQWAQSVVDLLGDSVTVTDNLPPDQVVDLFSTVGASAVVTSYLDVERYELAALDVTGQIFADSQARVALVGCELTAVDDACAEDFLRGFMRRAFRRPPTQEEVARYLDLGIANEELYADPWVGLSFATAAVLQSPHFLYLVETGEPDPEEPTRYRYTDWEMAGRLAAFLWGSVPDDELLDAAAAGELTDPDGLQAQIDRMLEDPRVRPATMAFFHEYLHLEALGNVAKDPEIFPEASPALMAAMRGEVERMVEELVFDDDADLRSLFTTSRTWLNDDLAALYGLPAPDPATLDEEGFGPVDIPGEWARAGLFGTGAFLAANARVTRTSPTLRGFFVQKRLLCLEVPPPPPDVAAELPEFEEHVTMRERVEAHLQDPTCAGCHDYMDPLGLALEHFDGLGRHRDDDLGLPIDASGEIGGTAFSGLQGMAGALVEQPELTACLTKQVYRHAIGHHESKEEKDGLALTAEAFDQGGARLLELMAAVAGSEGFRFLGPAGEGQ